MLWVTLRAWHAGTAIEMRGFLTQLLTMLLAGPGMTFVRADAGFFETAFLDALEARALTYSFVACLTQLLAG
ncbi:MAG: hypothetical protein NW703_12080 [Nitrospiraceae bacterium]